MGNPAFNLHAFRAAQRRRAAVRLRARAVRRPEPRRAQHLAEVLLRRRRARRCSIASANCPSTTRRAPSCASSPNAPSEIAAQIGPDAEIIEFGAGSLTKVRLLLDALESPRRYVPIDISGAHLEAAAERLRADYPQLAVQPVVADYTMPLVLPPARGKGAGQRVGFFPGSTLGNFSPDEALAFLQLRAPAAARRRPAAGRRPGEGPGGAACRLQRRPGRHGGLQPQPAAPRQRRAADATSTSTASRTRAFYNAPMQRIEMHLVSRRAQAVHARRPALPASTKARRSTPRTRTSSPSRACARWPKRPASRPAAVWTDPERLFSVHWLQAPAAQ